MNIDEDIERLENLIGFVGCELREIEAQSIENVLSRLKEYKDIEQDYIANEEKLVDLISKLEKELETYKKIAEKLAFKVNELDISGSCHLLLPKDWDCKKYKNCKQCIIDWARKEVEKDDNR